MTGTVFILFLLATLGLTAIVFNPTDLLRSFIEYRKNAFKLKQEKDFHELEIRAKKVELMEREIRAVLQDKG